MSFTTIKNNPNYYFFLSLLSIILLLITFLYITTDPTDHKETTHQQALLTKRLALLKSKPLYYGKWLHSLNQSVAHTEGDIIWNSEQQSGTAMFINLPKTKANHYYQIQLFDLNNEENKKPLTIRFKKPSNANKLLIVDLKIPTKKLIQPFKFTLSLVNENQAKPTLLLLAQP